MGKFFKHTAVTKDKMSRILRKNLAQGKRLPPALGHKGVRGSPQHKAVRQLLLDRTYVATWPSITAAKAGTGIHMSNISLCANGQQLSAGGFIWEFVAFGANAGCGVHARKRIAMFSPENPDKPSREFTSLTAAAAAMNLSKGAISQAARNYRGKVNSAGGWIWRYVDSSEEC